MAKINADQMKEASQAMVRLFRRWRVIPITGNEFLVIDVSEFTGRISPVEGETMRFWRFDNKIAADRFRNHQVAGTMVEVMLELIAEGA